MATMTYQQWLEARSRRAGQRVASSAAEAAAFRNWQSQQPEYQAANPQPTPAPVVPTNTDVNPDDLLNAILKDPDALLQAAGARQSYDTGLARATADYQTARSGLAAQIPQFGLEQELGLRSAASRGAARGTAASGQTELEKQQTRTNYANQVADTLRQVQGVDTGYQGTVGQLASEFNQGYTGAFRDAARRYQTTRLDDFDNAYGINSGLGANVPSQALLDQQNPPAPTPPKPIAPPRVPSMTYKDFLAKHPGQRSNPTLAEKWRKRFA